MYTQNVIDELSLKYSGFDFESAMNELKAWKDELDPDSIEDSITLCALDSVMDLIIDNSSF